MFFRRCTILALLILAIVFSGPITASRAQSSTAITMWDIPESDPYTHWWEGYVKSFNSANSDIQVTMEVFESAAYKTKLIGALNTNTAADIVYNAVGPDGFAYYHAGKFIALDNLLDTKLFAQGALDRCSMDGHVVCMPLYLAPNFLYYNKALFAKAGVDAQKWANPFEPTWEEFLAACDKLKAAGIVPIALGNADQWPGLMWYAAFQNRFGGTDELFNARDSVKGGTYTAPGFVKGAQMLQELDKRGYLPVGYNGIGGDQKYALFTQGNAAIIYQGPWMLGYIKDGTPADFQYGIFNFPSFTDGKPDSQTDVQAGVDALWITSSSKNPKAAATFLNGFAEPNNALTFANDTLNISVIKSVDIGKLNGSLGEMVIQSNKAAHFTPWLDAELPAPVAEALLFNIQGLFSGQMTPEAFTATIQAAAKH